MVAPWLNRLSRPSQAQTMNCHRFGEKQAETAKGGGKG